MKQLKLPLNPRNKVVTATTMFFEVSQGITNRTFLKWLKEREERVRVRAYNKGLEDGKPKEKYQGEFGARSNY